MSKSGKIIATSSSRYNGGVAAKRKYGSSTITKFLIYREENANDVSKWVYIEGFGPTPGDRKTDAIKRFVEQENA
jgi:hypothetical protein